MVGAVHLRFAIRRLLLAVVAVAVCGAIVWFGHGLMPAASLPTQPTPARSFAWGDRIPLSKTMLTQWLRAHGVSYTTWANRHPAAAAKLVSQ
jgi:hypothetical protein